MPETFEPCLEVLPEAQRQIWPLLGFSSGLNFVLYGGTAVALHLAIAFRSISTSSVPSLSTSIRWAPPSIDFPNPTSSR